MSFEDKAAALEPHLFTENVTPIAETEPIGRYMRTGDYFTLDFGTHIVGFFELEVEADCRPDSPLQIVFDFAEMMFELDDAPYSGGLSSTWFQRETVYLDDVLSVRLPRRYAFRYVRVTFPGNTAYRVRYVGARCETVTSADINNVPELSCDDEQLALIDDISLRTLRNCMQSVFEDGPKRDRRLWLGDLYLQAKVNYVTYGNDDLVRRSLYLFAAAPHEDGCLSSAVYYKPRIEKQSWILHDYALFFVGALFDHYQFAGDIEFVRELWPIAFRQIEIAVSALDEYGRVPTDKYFIDWCEGLDKTCAAQGLAISMLRYGLELARLLKSDVEAEYISKYINVLTKAALTLYDRDRGIFVTPSGQISRASQMWIAAARILSDSENADILRNVNEYKESVDTVTPFAKHFYVQALIDCGLVNEAEQLVRSYWGGMASADADCFWEVYVPSDAKASPYGDYRINSYCHAWSCTPSYFIRKYFQRIC